MKRNLGFTLLELLVVVVIIGLLAGYVAPRYFSQVGKSEVQVARAQIDSLEKALDQYRLDKRRYPTAEEGLAAVQPYLKKTLPTDPWGRPVRLPRQRRKRRVRGDLPRPRRQDRRQRRRRRHQRNRLRSTMHFNVLAVDARQQVVSLNLEAASATLAADELRQRGLTLLSAAVEGARAFPALKRKAKFDTTLFSVELASLLGAGLNLVEALQTLADKDAHGERREVLAGLLAAIRRGEPFSQAVGRLPAAVLAALRRHHQVRRAHRQPEARRSAATSPTRRRSSA